MLERSTILALNRPSCPVAAPVHTGAPAAGSSILKSVNSVAFDASTGRVAAACIGSASAPEHHRCFLAACSISGGSSAAVEII